MMSRQLKEYDKALAFTQAMQAINPKDVRSYRIETAIHVDRDDSQAVIRSASQGLAQAPSDPNLHYLISLAYIFTEQSDLALNHLKQAKENRSFAKDISLWEGIVHEKMGDVDLAVLSYERATQEMPKDLRAWARGGVLLAEKNRCKEARRFLSNAIGRGAPIDPQMKKALQQCPQ